jgi:hypothetical protein
VQCILLLLFVDGAANWAYSDILGECIAQTVDFKDCDIHMAGVISEWD